MSTYVPDHYLLDYWAAENPSLIALVYGDDRFTFADLKERRDRVLALFKRRGIGEGSVIVAAVGNHPDFIPLFFAAYAAGALMILSDTALDSATLRERVDSVSADLVVVSDPKHRSKVGVPLCTTVPVYTIGADDDRLPPLVEMIAEEGLEGIGNRTEPVTRTPKSEQRMFSNPLEHERQERKCTPDAAFIVMYTSGSTGVPKGVELTGRGLFGAARNLAGRLLVGEDDVVYAPLPLSHMFGLVCGMLVSLVAGARLLLTDRISAKASVDLLVRERVTVLHGVPTMFLRELAVLRETGRSPSELSLRTGIVAGTQVPACLIEQIQDQMCCSAVIAYGSTETVNVSCGFPEDSLERRSHTVGRVFEGVEVQIVDELGRVVPCGSDGELLVKGEMLFCGYLDEIQGGIRPLDEGGWFHTGDIARIDEAGYLSIIGRMKDMIIRGGNNVYPSALEAVYARMEGVAEVCVVGYPDDEFGERVALVVAVEGPLVKDEESLREFARDRVPKYAVPDRVMFLDEFPKLGNGKVDKRALKAYVNEMLQT